MYFCLYLKAVPTTIKIGGTDNEFEIVDNPTDEHLKGEIKQLEQELAAMKINNDKEIEKLKQGEQNMKKLSLKNEKLEMEKRDLTALNNELSTKVTLLASPSSGSESEEPVKDVPFSREDVILVGSDPTTVIIEESALLPTSQGAVGGVVKASGHRSKKATKEDHMVSDLLVQLQEERTSATNLMSKVNQLEKEVCNHLLFTQAHMLSPPP